MSDDLQPYKGKTGRGSHKVLPVETGDLKAILDVAIDGSIKRCGRPAVYPDNDKGLDDFVQKSIDYLQYVNDINSNPDIDNKLIPDVEGWALFLGITRQTVFNYELRGGQWLETIQFYKNAFMACKKQLALTFKIPPVFAIFDAVNNTSARYYNTSQFQITTTQEEESRKKTPDEEARAAGLVWDEFIGEYVPDKRRI